MPLLAENVEQLLGEEGAAALVMLSAGLSFCPLWTAVIQGFLLPEWAGDGLSLLERLDKEMSMKVVLEKPAEAPWIKTPEAAGLRNIGENAK